MPDPLPIRLIRLGAIEPVQTQAIYHAVAEQLRADSPDTIILCAPLSPYVCLGYHQVFDSVLDREECERLKLPVVRRQVGGGATYLDSNQIFYQCIFHQSRVPSVFTRVFATMLAAPVAVLVRLGLNATLSKINEIKVDSRRIAGTGGGIIQEASVVVGNILFDFNYQTMARLWHVPSEAFRDLAYQAMRDHMTTLRQLRVTVEAATIEQMLVEEYARALGRPLEESMLSAAELEHAQVVGERLTSNEYLSLHDDRRGYRPLKIAGNVYIHAEKAQAQGTHVRGTFRVSDGVIEQVRLESEPPRDWSATERRLVGVPFEKWQSRVAG